MRKFRSVDLSITAQNIFTEWFELSNTADLSISGVADSTVTVQRTFDGGATIKDVEAFTASTEKVMLGSNNPVLYRVGIKTGEYGTDTVVIKISG